MADTQDLGSCTFGMWVRVPLSAPVSYTHLADILDMFLIIEDGLIEVGDRPSLRNVELETLR